MDGICAIIVIFVALWLKYSLIELTMNMLRTAVGVAMLREPVKLLQRTAFILIVIFFMTFNSYLQSKLSSLLVIKPQEKIEKAQDLLNLGYQIQTTNYFRQYFNHSVLYEYVSETNDISSCIRSLSFKNLLYDCGYIKQIVGNIKNKV